MASQSDWNEFFLNAKIRKDVAPLYAETFYKNRMSFDMLADLTKDYLKDLDITVLGDIISILKHPRTGFFKMTSASEWNDFFLGAKMPKDVASLYAKKFFGNRMSFGMLADLTKDYLRDLGITALGDIISILKHAKNVQSKQDSEVSTVLPEVKNVAADQKVSPAPAPQAQEVPKQTEKKMMSDLIACSICMKSFTLESDISTTPCGHVFHSDCIEKTDCLQCRKAYQSEQIIKLCFTESQSAIEEQISINDSEQKSLEFDEKMLELEEKRRMCDEQLSEKSTEIIQAKKKYQKLEKEKLEKKLGFRKTEKNFKKSIIEANKQIKTLEKEKKRLEPLEGLKNKLEEENLQLKTNASDLKKSMDAEINRNKDLDEKLKEANQKIEDLKEENLQLKANESILKKTIDEETNRNKTLDKNIKDANQEIENLKEVNLDSRVRDFPEFQKFLKMIVDQFMALECGQCEYCKDQIGKDQSTINYIYSRFVKIAKNVGEKIQKLDFKCEACNSVIASNETVWNVGVNGDQRLRTISTKFQKPK